jgi:hypothetical protein
MVSAAGLAAVPADSWVICARSCAARWVAPHCSAARSSFARRPSTYSRVAMSQLRDRTT